MNQPFSGLSGGELVKTSSAGSCSPPPSHPHTLPSVSLSPSQAARGWLTFDGWQADGSRCRRGTSSAWFHSVSPPPSSLVNKTEFWEKRWVMCLRYKWLLMVRVSLTRHDAYLFCLSYSRFSIYSTLFPPLFFFLPLISLVNLTRCESVSGRGCSSMLWMSNTSHMNWMTGWAL